MSQDAIARLEELVGRLLVERSELLRRNQILVAEQEQLRRRHDQIGEELDKVLAKLTKARGKAS